MASSFLSTNVVPSGSSAQSADINRSANSVEQTPLVAGYWSGVEHIESSEGFEKPLIFVFMVILDDT